MSDLLNREPKAFFRYFQEISAIPRGSGNEKALGDYLVGFALSHNLECVRDEVGNVLIRKPAFPSARVEDAVLLQGHMDMVCEKNAGTVHDFTKDPIKLVEKDGFLYAEGTTLGADDGVAVAYMLAILDDDTILHPDLECLFTVQEEIGTRGAKVAAYTVKPDYAIVLETTTACDFSGNDGEKRVCELGKGCVVSYMDRSTIYDRELYRLGFEKAKEINVPCQTKTLVAGGNDSGAIHSSVGGIRTVALSVPCRYLHSPSCMIKKSDVQSTAELAYAMYLALAEK